jgi:KipI family sensor histidine kinase inhibitor
MRSPEQTIVDPAESDGPRVLAMGDAAVLVELADLDAVLAHAAAIEAAGWPGVVDVVPGARTVVVTVRPGTDLGALRRDIQTLDVAPIDAADGETVEIPVVYDGPDLAEVAELTGLDADEVVAAHTGTPWRVGFGGFAPGFAYLTGGDPRLNVERRSEPRTSVPPGSVGLAGEFSGIYPRSSPGGWQLIGRTDAPLWDATRTPPALLTPGAQVRFLAQRRDADAGAQGPTATAAPDDAGATRVAPVKSQAGPSGRGASAGDASPAVAPAMAERAAAAVGLAVVPRRALEVVEVGPLALV